MTLSKDNTIALTGTIIVHLGLLVLLLFFGLESSKPAGEEGLLVNFGNVDEASGMFEPAGIEAGLVGSAPAVESVQIEKTEELMNQNIEKSVTLAEQKKKEVEQNRIDEQRLRLQQEHKASEIRKQTASVFAKSSGQAGSQGTSATGTGNQGSTEGSVLSTNTKGGGYGLGNFSLSGRSIDGALPLPSYSIQEEGIVVVQIVVNPKGNVISAAISLQGTNTDNGTLRSAALSAARLARFNTIQGNQNQGGTITYQYRLK